MTACKAPFGSWDSPIKAQMLATASIKLGQTFIDENYYYWIESRPAEKGRSLLMAADRSAQIKELTPPDFNIRSTVHEYGGGAAVISSGQIFFSNFSDRRIYKQDIKSQKPEAISKECSSRFADFALDQKRNRLILVQEEHFPDGSEPLNYLSALSLESESEPEILLAGSDFFSSPRISPDGKLLAWISWNHPHMPWDESKLWTGNLGNDGSLSNIQLVAGGNGEAVSQPEWGPDGTLYFVSDKSGWLNLWASYSGLVDQLSDMEAEFASPAWIFGLSNYAVHNSNKLICSYNQSGIWRLGKFDPENRTLSPIETPYQDISYLRLFNDEIILRGGAPDRFAEIASLNLSNNEIKVLRRSNELALDPAYFSHAEPIEFESSKGIAHAFFYAPKNKNYQEPAREAELPPLLVKSHGGPTAAASNTLELSIQYWTSRGFAVVDVNYGGSTGFGKEYVKRLDKSWGIVDVDDCVGAVKFLSKNKRVDKERVAISGGSAGGYTTLCALAFQPAHFAAGASYYGVSDPSSLATDTHKFESRYLDRLIGPYPQAKETYDQRSPLLHATNISCPVIFFQGLDDKVVPPSQSEAMASALKASGIPLAYFSFAGEQHGFRQSETIKTCLEAELSFYCRVFSIERNDSVKLDIENSDKLKELNPSKH